MGQREHFMSAEFDGTGLMDCDVTGLRTENALIGAEKCVDDGSVCLGSAHEEIDSRIWSTAGFADLIPGRFRELVETIPGSLHHICGEQLIHDSRMGAFHVIADEFQFFICHVRNLTFRVV